MKSRPDGTGPAMLARNYVQGCLLLLLAEAPTHGYELVAQLAELGMTNIDSSAVYRALRGLNDDGLVESAWEHSEHGPARRTYRVTGTGEDALARWAGTVAASSIYLRAFLARHRRLGELQALVAG